MYLGPLRLLALEQRDRLTEMGCPCSLITGEERDEQSLTHSARTVEMTDFSRKFEVAILDEWVRFWFKGELLPLPGDLLKERDAARAENEELRREVARLIHQGPVQSVAFFSPRIPVGRLITHGWAKDVRKSHAGGYSPCWQSVQNSFRLEAAFHGVIFCGSGD